MQISEFLEVIRDLESHFKHKYPKDYLDKLRNDIIDLFTGQFRLIAIEVKKHETRLPTIETLWEYAFNLRKGLIKKETPHLHCELCDNRSWFLMERGDRKVAGACSCKLGKLFSKRQTIDKLTPASELEEQGFRKIFDKIMLTDHFV